MRTPRSPRTLSTRVILVGGSHARPRRAAALSQADRGKTDRPSPGQVVALGAAVHAPPQGEVKDVLLLYVTPLFALVGYSSALNDQGHLAHTTIPSLRARDVSGRVGD